MTKPGLLQVTRGSLHKALCMISVSLVCHKQSCIARLFAQTSLEAPLKKVPCMPCSMYSGLHNYCTCCCVSSIYAPSLPARSIMHILHTCRFSVDYMNCVGLAQPCPNYKYVMVRTCKENLITSWVNAVKRKTGYPMNMTPKKREPHSSHAVKLSNKGT